MKREPKRTCPSCGTELSGAMEFCPVCTLRQGLSPEGESGESSSEEAVKPTPEQVTHRFEHYELVMGEDGKPAELGRGAMGVTFKAFDVDLQCPVALKVISQRYLGDESVRLRFLREARAAARLRNSNVASVLHLGRTGSSYFYAMEFVAGETLERLIQESGRLEVKLALEIATQVAAGLAAVHKQNLVHRDIKPGNIMVSLEDGGAVSAKIIDLGLAKAGNEPGGQSAISTPGTFVGTPEFASPEQFAGVGVDIRSDLYSLGVTLWEMLTGRVPFRGTPAEVMYQHQHAPLPLEQLKGFSPSVVALLEVLLAKDPAHRFQSPGELLKALELGTTRRKAAKIPGWLAAVLPIFKNRVLVWSAIILLVAGGLIVGVEIFLGYRHPIFRAIAAPEKSIAVLPFESLSEDKNDSYFADGIQDEILSNLAKVSQLKVISRTSVMSYRQTTNRDLPSIADALGVAHVVEGTVRRNGNRIRVTIELVDARTDATLWSESYDRDLTDIFAIQSDIAQIVASKLSARLSPYERKDIEEKPTRDLEAYDLYLRAKELIANAELFEIGDERENLLNAIRFLEEAARSDSQFVLAYCLAARAHDDLYLNIDRSATRRALGDAAVNEALRLQPDFAEAHLAAARHLYYCYHDYEKVRIQIAIIQRALPNNPEALTLAAMADRRQGRWDESTKGLQRVVSLDPRNPEGFTRLFENYLCLRRYREAEKVCDRLLELGTDTPGFKVQKALLAFNEKADVTGYRAALEALPPSAKQDMGTTADRVYFAALDQDWTAAKEILSNSPHEELIFFCGTAVPRACVEIWLAMVRGEHPTMEGRFGSARDELKRRLDADPSDPRLLSALGVVDAALGRKDDAIQEAKHAVELQSISQDAMDGPSHVYSLAVVYAQTNEPDLAFQQLAILARTTSSWTSYGLFKLDPGFDPLREDPRFRKLLAQLAHE